MKTKQFIFPFFSFAILLASCCDRADRSYTIADSNEIQRTDGQLLKFKDSSGDIDTFVVDILTYQAQEAIIDHYYHEKCVEALAYCENQVCRFRNLHDTEITQALSPDAFQSSGHSFRYLRYVTIVESVPYEKGTLTYAYNEPFQLNQMEMKNGIVVDGVSYDGVYIIESDSINIWFNNIYGLLRFELPDGNWRELAH